MRKICFALIVVLALSTVLGARAAFAQWKKSENFPNIVAKDIRGKDVSLAELAEQKPGLVIVFFFTPESGGDLALKLQSLYTLYGGKDLEVVGIGWEEDAEALKAFAEQMDIHYFLVPRSAVPDAQTWAGKVDVVPLTLFVIPQTLTIERILRGGGKTKAELLAEVAENFFRARRLDAAKQAAAEAASEPQVAPLAKELTGYIYLMEGKLDEAEKEFGAIDAKTGLAKVALGRGDTEKAVQLAEQAAGDPYAQTIKGEALLREGKTEEAGQVLSQISGDFARDWQASEAVNLQGRVEHQAGNVDAALPKYEKAIALDPYNIVALSNEGAALRDKGDLKKSAEVLEKAQALGANEVTVAMLRHVQQEMEEANNIQKAQLIRQQIADLQQRYEALKNSADQMPQDAWTTRPLILAFLPSSSQNRVFFEQAGTDVVLQRELELRLAADGRVGVVERSMLDKLLQELQLGASDLASSDTQRRLGRVLSAGLLGFLDFGKIGKDTMVYVRFVDTETTGITFQTSRRLDEQNPLRAVDELVAEILNNVASSRELKGLVADVTDDKKVLINLGKRHGAKKEQTFTIFEEGDPVEVGGRVIAHRQRPIGKLVIETLEDDYSVCTIQNLREGATIRKEMKVKAD